MRRSSAPSTIAAAALIMFVASCSPATEAEFDQYEAMERISTADLIGELVDRAAENHWTKRYSLEALDELAAQPLDGPRFGGSGSANREVVAQEEPSDYLASYKDFASLFEGSHGGDSEASLAIAHFYAHKGGYRNLVRAMMYLKLADTQGAPVSDADFADLSSQMNTFEIGLSDRAFELCSIENGVVEGDFGGRVISDCHFDDWAGEWLDISLGISPNRFSGLNAEDLEE